MNNTINTRESVLDNKTTVMDQNKDDQNKNQDPSFKDKNQNNSTKTLRPELRLSHNPKFKVLKIDYDKNSQVKKTELKCPSTYNKNKKRKEIV